MEKRHGGSGRTEGSEATSGERFEKSPTRTRDAAKPWGGRTAMISQPMGGLAPGEIERTRVIAKAALEEMGYEVINTYFACENEIKTMMNKTKSMSVYLLAKAIERMSQCDAVWFCRGWEQARGCRIEHEVAEKYGLRCLYEQ